MKNLFFDSPDNEFVLVHFRLEFLHLFQLRLPEFMLLRRELLNAAYQALGDRHSKRLKDLFDPPLANDPVALRRFQKPSPPFAILVEPEAMRDYDAGDCLDLTVTFWGRGGQMIGDFARVLQALGNTGFHRGQGMFELSAIEAEDSSEHRIGLWAEHDNLQMLAPPFVEVGWWLNRKDTPTTVRLTFLTPARLISQGRPVFHLDFKRLFPFVLRRVTSMHYAHCDNEVIADPEHLIAAASMVRELENSLRWQDWRTLSGQGKAQDLGGVVGSVRLGGDALLEVLDILRIGSLMNVGKGAAFGAGCFRLQEESKS